MREREDPPINPATSLLESFDDVPDSSIIIRSSDNVNFPVHKSVLAMASPFFKDLLSLPQPLDSENVDGIPVVQLPESAELLNSLISILYPVCTVIPNSYEKVLYFACDWSALAINSYYKVLYLLAACQKYEMVSVQSSIRAEVSRGNFPAPKGTEAFLAYAIAAGKGLVPEMENAARQTLDQSMTFDVLGEGLQLFDGWALSDLAYFRRRCRDALITCLDSFLEAQPPGPSSIWTSCPEATSRAGREGRTRVLPTWLNGLLSRNQNDLKLQKFTVPLDIHSRIRGEYLTALQSHVNCNFCFGVHVRNGSTFSAELENKLAEARNKVPNSFTFQVPRTDIYLSQVCGVCGSHSDSTYLSPRNR